MPLKSLALMTRAIMLAVIAIVTIVSIGAVRVWQDYHSTKDYTAQYQDATIKLFEANADVMFQAIEVVLDRVLAEGEKRSGQDNDTLAQHFAQIAEPWDFVYGIGLVDSEGRLRGAARRNDGRQQVMPTANVRTSTSYFTAHRDGLVPPGQVHISDPYPGQNSGVSVVAITKGIVTPDGAFGGIAAVTVKLETFERMFASLVSDPYVTLGLYKSNATTILTVPTRAEGEIAQERGPIFTMIDRGTLRGSFNLPDGERQVAFAVLQKYPVVLSFGLDPRLFLTQWFQTTLALTGASLVAIVIISGMTWWLSRQIRAEATAQQTLQESESRLRESQRIASVGHFERDLNTGKTHWAESMYKLHGLTAEQYPEGLEAMFAVVHPDDKPGILDRADHATPSTLRAGSAEHRILRPDGEERVIRYEWRPIEGFGEGVRLFGVAQDITDIRLAEEALRQNQSRLQDILECSSDFIWEMDAEGKIGMFAGQGIDRFQLAGQSGQLVEEVEGSEAELVRAAVAQREPFRNRILPVRVPKGELLWIRVSGKPIFGPDGTYLGYRGAGADVTENRRQRQIDEDRRKAEALGLLASGIAHEINNLLQPIIIYSSFGVAQVETSEAQKRYFSRIGRAAEAATQIVRNVLSFARQRPPHRQPVVLADAVRETVDLLGDALPSGVVRSVGPIDDGCVVTIDRSGFDQVLTNLITNAAEAMPSGGRITIGATMSHVGLEEAGELGIAPGRYCILSVADTGAGIPPDQIAKVFDPFFTTKPQGKGTGLGLSVVAGHAKSWGGAAAVSSAIGVGTVFNLYLPASQQQMLAAQ